MTSPGPLALRGRAISFHADPFVTPDCLVVFDDALLVMEDGLITAFGDHAALRPTLPVDLPVTAYGNAILCPGFIDAHVHYPQLEMIGAYGEQLLPWLETYTFPAEQRFEDPAHAGEVARLFLQELLRAGTTTACVYCTVHPHSVDALFVESERLNTRMVAGKMLMDRNAPARLLDTAQRGYDESAGLIARWHRRGRQHYCVTPRFAPTSTEAQLEAAGALLRLADGLFLQTHLAESPGEVDWVRALFPKRRDYLDVYAHAGLAGHRSVFGHAIHLTEPEFCTCHAAGAALAHCPTSNLFLGSGLFRMFDATRADRPVRVGLGTDVGAGTSLSMPRTMGEAYKVAALNGTRLSARQAFYLATLGGARALYLDDRIGRLAPGHDADIVVLDPEATPLQAFRAGYCDSMDELLFMLMTLATDRTIRATYVAGRCLYDRDAAEPMAPVTAPARA